MTETLSSKIGNMVKPSADSSIVIDADSSPKEVIRELKEVYYKSEDTSLFDRFHKEGDAPGVGEYSFSVDSRFLKYACGVLKHTYTGSKINPNLIKIVIFETQLKLSGFNNFSFGEVFIPLTKISSVGKNPEISFAFDFPTLAKITTSFPNHELSFNYIADKAMLTMDSGETHLELSVREATDFIQYHNNIVNILPVECNLNVEILQTALNYLSMYSEKNESQESLSVIDCRDSAIVGGSVAAIGYFKSPSLLNVPLKLKQEVVSVLSKVLPFFDPAKTKLFETDTYFIIRDQNLFLGLEKTEVSFPSLKTLLSLSVDETINLPRSAFVSSLQKLSVVAVAKNILVKFKLYNKNPEAKLILSIQDFTGKKSRDVLSISRQSAQDLQEREFYVGLENLLKTLNFFKSETVTFQLLKDKAVLVKDVEESYETATVLSIAKDI